jgi:hypothetical protein
VSDLELVAESVEAFRDVAGAVVGHDALDVYAVGGEEGHRSLKEVGTRVLVFCGQHLGIGNSGMVIHCDVCVLPAGTADTLGAVVVDTMARAGDPSQFLGIQVQ